ncbi:alpha/beta hydrolase [Psychrobacter pygoscelis]|uniref:alpha/beta hydrolase n=1 Tax=Psychrobacter pygoscelis TaxID=2488563 RepID=UPI001040ACDA|nr:alpha/beta fold hydrolase [Psychrobacter pygoscelis]
MSQKQLIKAPAGVLEVEALWQQDNPNAQDVDTVALLCHPHPLFQGTMTNKVVTTMYRFARDNGMHVVRFNFRGVGASTGEHDNAVGEITDALTVLQWIADETPARKLWLGGFSFGGYIAARAAEQLLVSPHIWGLEDFELIRLALIAPSVVNNDVSDIMLPTKRTFEIFGDADEVIDPESMHQFAKRLDISVKIIPGAGHFFHGRLGELKDAIAEFSNTLT